MKISLLKLIQNQSERNPSIKGTEAEKFLKFLLDEDGWGTSERAWQAVFSEYSRKAQQDFIEEMKNAGWISEVMVNHLDVEVKLTEKAKALFTQNP